MAIKYKYKVLTAPILTGDPFPLEATINDMAFLGDWEFVSFTTIPTVNVTRQGVPSGVGGPHIDLKVDIMDGYHSILFRRLEEVPEPPAE